MKKFLASVLTTLVVVLTVAGIDQPAQQRRRPPEIGFEFSLIHACSLNRSLMYFAASFMGSSCDVLPLRT